MRIKSPHKKDVESRNRILQEPRKRKEISRMDEKKRQRRKDRILLNCFVYGILTLIFILGFIFGYFLSKGIYDREQEQPKEEESPRVEFLEVTPVPSEPSKAIDVPEETVSTVTSKKEPETPWTDAIATAYCSCEKCCGHWATVRPKDADGNPIVYGAAGIVLEQGVSIAADTDIYPIGTVIEIENLGTYIVQDRGGAIKGQHIDVYFASHEAALQFGKQEVRIRVIE